MTGWLYLIKNRDLYKIGITKNFANRMRQLKPDNVVAKLYSSDFVKLERQLHKRYKKFRIPQTEYFRLDEYHLKEIKLIISKLHYPTTITLEIFIKSLLLILLIFFLMLLYLSLFINEVNTIILSSILWMQRITFVYSFLSIFIHSGKYFNFMSELKYRFSRSIVFILFYFLFRIASASFQ